MMMEFGNVREILDLGSFKLTGWHIIMYSVYANMGKMFKLYSSKEHVQHSTLHKVVSQKVIITQIESVTEYDRHYHLWEGR